MVTSVRRSILLECTRHPSEKRSKYDLSQPWSHKGFLYATDGVICVRTACATPERFGTGGGYPNAGFARNGDALPWDLPSDFEALPLPPIDNNAKACEKCQGAGWVPAERCLFYDDYDGLLARPTCTYFSQCDMCCGKGVLPPTVCPECAGVGTVGWSCKPFVVANGASIAEPYLRMIARHNAVLYGMQGACRLPAGDLGQAAFRFECEGDVVGVLMPCKLKAEVRPGSEGKRTGSVEWC